jgi:arylsulfatase A-like enzyme
LEKKGLSDNTWIIYNSDHGEMLGDHMMSHKIVFYEQAIKIPLIIRPPGGIKGWECSGLTDQIDIAATLLDIAGADSLVGSEGRSLYTQILEGPENVNAQSGKSAIFSEVFGFSMVREENYKLTVTTNKGEPVEFFDLVNDPEELSNQVNNPKFKQKIEKMIKTHFQRLFKFRDNEKLVEFQEYTKGRIESGRWARWAKDVELKHLD